MKGNQRIALVLTLLVVAVAAVTSQAETSLYEARKGERLYSIRYPGLGGKENAEEILYSDSYFSQPSTATNAKLAHASMALSAAAYSEPLIRQALDDLGFIDVRTMDYRTHTFEENDYVAFAMAWKPIRINGEYRELIVIVLRGTTLGWEWNSNFVLWPFGIDQHTDFTISAAKVQEAFREYYEDICMDSRPIQLDDFWTADNSNNMLWICGHSRGGAAANILAKEMNSLSYADFESIYAYTFASPNVKKMSAGNAYDSSNIHNYVNMWDLITLVPPAYSRYGVDEYEFPGSNSWEKTISGFAERSGVRYHPQTYDFQYELDKMVHSYENFSLKSLLFPNISSTVTSIKHAHSMEFYLSWTKPDMSAGRPSLAVPSLKAESIHTKRNSSNYDLVLSWLPVKGANGYRIYMESGSGDSHTIQTSETENTRVRVKGLNFEELTDISIAPLSSQGNDPLVSVSQPVTIYCSEWMEAEGGYLYGNPWTPLPTVIYDLP